MLYVEPTDHLKLPRLIGIAGAAGSGKDTLAQALCGLGCYTLIRFADPLKDAVAAILQVSRKQLEDRTFKEAVGPSGHSPRVLMQTLGTEWGREICGENFWVDMAAARVKSVYEADALGFHERCGVVIPDVRFDNEVQWIKDNGGVVIYIDRPNAQVTAAHKSEKPPAGLDATVRNDGAIAAMVTRSLHKLAELYWRTEQK